VQALRSRQEPVDAVTVTAEIERAGKVEQAGGADYIADLSEAAAQAANVDHHGRIVRDAAQARRLRSLLAGAVAALDEGWAIGRLDGMRDAVGGVTDAATRLLAGRQRQDMHTHRDAVRLAVEQAQRSYEATRTGTHGDGLPWLLPMDHDGQRPTLASILPPMVGGDLIAIAARTGGGKTVSGWQLGHDVATATGRVTDYFTSEVDAAGVGMRSLARGSGVDGMRLRTGALTDGDIDRMMQYAKHRASVPVMVWDSPTQTIEYIGAMLRIIEAQRPEAERGGLVVIDYYQRVDSSEAARQRLDKTRRLEYVSRAAKVLAGTIGRPVVMLAQLRRDIEWGKERKEDIEGSKTLGDEASAVIIVRNAAADLPESAGAPPGYAEMTVAKSRNGAAGRTIAARFNGPHQQFEAWPGERWKPGRQ
jgi:replicative DNA helicase